MFNDTLTDCDLPSIQHPRRHLNWVALAWITLCLVLLLASMGMAFLLGVLWATGH